MYICIALGRFQTTFALYTSFHTGSATGSLGHLNSLSPWHCSFWPLFSRQGQGSQHLSVGIYSILLKHKNSSKWFCRLWFSLFTFFQKWKFISIHSEDAPVLHSFNDHCTIGLYFTTKSYVFEGNPRHKTRHFHPLNYIWDSMLPQRSLYICKLDINLTCFLFCFLQKSHCS